MKKIITLFLCLILCLALIPVSAFAAEDIEDPFIPVSSTVDDEVFVESATEAVFDAAANESWYGGWQQIGGKWYFIDANTGAYATGLCQDSKGNCFYFDNSGVMQTGWQKIYGYWYYFNSAGYMVTGWLKSGSSWFLMSTASTLENGRGTMLTGWQKSGGKWYYLQSNGAMKTGWLKDGGKWYYLDSSGAMKTGWVKSAGKWYFMDGSGAMKTGWVKSSGKWYYMLDDGSMATLTLIWDENWNAYYGVDENGVMITNATWVYQGVHYHFGADGKCDNRY